MYKNAYYRLLAATINAITKIDELEIKEAREILIKAQDEIHKDIIFSDEEI